MNRIWSNQTQKTWSFVHYSNTFSMKIITATHPLTISIISQSFKIFLVSFILITFIVVSFVIISSLS